MEKESLRSGMVDIFSWISWVPLKVNCFCWRVLHNRVPVAACLKERGVAGIPTLCSLCSNDDEDVEHAFFSCSFASQVWRWFISWSGLIDVVPCNRSHLISLLNNPMQDRNKDKLRKTLIYSVVWCLWKSRNSSLFLKCKNSPFKTADEIQLMSYNWCKYRARLSSLDWFVWIVSPCNACTL